MKGIKGNMKLIIGVAIGILISVTTSYSLAETLINSKDVSYVDNSKLGATNVQAAIDGTCTKFSNDLATLLDKMYPIGSIYISTSLSTPAQVGSAIGGTWETYGKGQTLVGIDTSQKEFETVGKTGGTSKVTLSMSNIPAHTHDISHTHTTPETNATYSLSTTGGTHSHMKADANFVAAGAESCPNNSCFNWNSSTGWGSRTLSSLVGGDGAHTHGITGYITVPKMTTNDISKTTSGSTGSGTSFSVQNPYITVYMYKRTK